MNELAPDREEFRAVVAALCMAALAARSPVLSAVAATPVQLASHALELADALLQTLDAQKAR